MWGASLKFITLFSGIGAPEVALTPLGWELVAVAEIEPFPCAVLKHYYPNVPNLGDVKIITGQQIEALGHIDAVIFGFPCQDLSVAGKRAGLKGERSGLFYDAMRIVRWSRARFAVAENVPGLFSSESGRDFAAVVGEMVGLELDVPRDGWRNTGVAAGPEGLCEWCVLDAQWFGVPQRRRRVFLVRDTGDWASREPILSLRESLSGNPPPRREKRQGATHELAPCIGASGRGFERAGETRGQDTVVPVSNRVRLPESEYQSCADEQPLPGSHRESVSIPGMPSSWRTLGRDTREQNPVVATYWDGSDVADCLDVSQLQKQQAMPEKRRFQAVIQQAPQAFNNTGEGWWNEAEAAATVRKGDNAGGGGARDGFDASEDGTGRGTPLVPCYGIDEEQNAAEELMGTLKAREKGGGFEMCVAFSAKDCGADAMEDCSPTLRAGGHTGSHANAGVMPAVALCEGAHGITEMDVTTSVQGEGGKAGQGYQAARIGMAVRRLTPRECERLQGFPDGYLDIIFRGKPASDGVKYKALGNAMCTKVVSWIGRRIQQVEELPNGS